MKKNKCVFLDRDGVLNVDRVDYAYNDETFKLIPEAMEALKELKRMGFVLVVVTNQSGIAKGVYSREAVIACHQKIQEASNHVIDALYYAPYHPEFDSASLTRKPSSLMFEKATAKLDIDLSASIMVGDKERDLLPAAQLGIPTRLLVTTHYDEAPSATHTAPGLFHMLKLPIFNN